jgi:hypothetical protein
MVCERRILVQERAVEHVASRDPSWRRGRLLLADRVDRIGKANHLQRTGTQRRRDAQPESTKQAEMINRLMWIALCGSGALVAPLPAATTDVGGIPATPLMTVYRFNGPTAVPYYDLDAFLRSGPSSPAGQLTQGTSVIPCLVIRSGKPVTDRQGTPYVGFEVVVDANDATPPSTGRFRQVFEQRKAMTVMNHHCPVSATHVIDVRKLYSLGKAPSFDPPRSAPAPTAKVAREELDEIVRAFHASTECETANRHLVGRREALQQAWSAFTAAGDGRWQAASLARARHLDFVMRTALYEGHLGRGCNAYGACERNVIALSVRNRALELCLDGQGCRSPGDFEGVSATVSQYNIWDEFLTQTTGLTSCFLRPDLTDSPYYARLQMMYEQSLGDVERILYGRADELLAVFPGNSLDDLTRVRHYYHPPAMGKCFPNHERLEYISGAVARRGEDFALIANTRIAVGERRGSGYLFRQALVDDEGGRDVVTELDRYPGFVIDGRKVDLQSASRCSPYGTPPGCRFEQVDRFRRTPSWLSAGQPLQLNCRVRSSGDDCRGTPAVEATQVGGACDTAMQPVAGVR